MTVRELIELLKNVNGDYEVSVKTIEELCTFYGGVGVVDIDDKHEEVVIIAYC